jgi:branched-chain amino acid transport system substrate-binding protein
VILTLGFGLTGAWGADTIKIGILGPMTGPSSDIGEPMMRGAKLAADEINKQGGIKVNGTQKRLELVIVDDEASPAKSVSGAQRLINKENVAVIKGPANSGCALAVRQVTNPAKVVLITPAINDLIVGPDYPFVFRSSCSYSDQVKALFDLLGEKVQKFALLHDTTGVGQGGATSFKQALEKKGKKPVIEETYEINTLNLMPQVTRIKNAGADFICWSGVGADAVTIGKAMKQIGLNIPVGGNNGLGMRVTLKAAEALEGWMFPDICEATKPEFQAFLKKYVAAYNDVPTYHPAAQGYDAIYLIAKGLERTKGEGGEALVKVFWDGISITGATARTGTGMNWSKSRLVGIDAS